MTQLSFLHAAGNRESNFQLSREGKLQVLRDLDREKEPYYSIIVKASSQRNWSPPRSQRAGRAQHWDLSTDLTLQEVRIFLDDINDQSPQFTKSEYTAGKDCWCLGGDPSDEGMEKQHSTDPDLCSFSLPQGWPQMPRWDQS